MYSRHIREFRERAVTVIATDPSAAIRWRETESFERSIGNHHPAWDWAGSATAPISPYLRAGMPSQGLREELRALLADPDFDAFFRDILGCPVTVANCRLVKSFPHQVEGVGPQSWHEDGTPAGILRGVLYLNDVDDHGGPFQYRDQHGAQHSLIGKAGDLLIFDAMRLRHRAMPPQATERYVIDFVFMPRLPGQELEVIAAGFNHWPADPFVYSVPRERLGPA